MADPSTAPSLGTCRRAIVAVHDFFVECYTGQTRALTRLEVALSDEFTLVSPDGTTLDREAVLELVQEKCDRYALGEFDIAITDVRRLDASPDHAVARYVERQELPSSPNSRLSTVVFATGAATPTGLSWVTVHESWLDVETQ